MSDEERLAEVLLAWEERFEQGEDIPAEELCRDHPEWIATLKARMHALKQAAWVKDAHPDIEDESPEVATTPLAASLILAGRYRLDERLAEGGSGEVWRGYDLELQRPVAIKLPRNWFANRGVNEAFLAEARKVARLKHPGIVPVFDVGRYGGAYFIVSDLIEGMDLRQRLSQQRFSVRQAVGYVAEVARHLHHAHQQGFIHRDIKPANILVDHQGQVFVTDFGIALTGEELPQRGGDGCGTLAYMSPEQLHGDPDRMDARTDIYGLGVVLYELLTHRLPFAAETPAGLRENILRQEPPPPRQFSREIPRAVETICLKCLAKSPANRYATANELADELTRWLQQRRVTRWVIQGLLLVASALLVFPLCRGQWQDPPGLTSGDPGLPVVPLAALLTDPEVYFEKEFLLDRIELSGEVKRRQAHPGYHVKFKCSDGDYRYQIDREWNGFIISNSMGEAIRATPGYPVRTFATLYCQLKQGKGKKWHVYVRRLDFLDQDEKVLRSLE